MTNHKLLNLLVLVSLLISLLAVGGVPAGAQDTNPAAGNPKIQQLDALQAAIASPDPINGPGNQRGNGQMRAMTQAERMAARLKTAAQSRVVLRNFAGINSATAAFSPLAGPVARGRPQSNPLLAVPNRPTTVVVMAAPLAQPDYFGVPNWANSPIPQLDLTGNIISGTGMLKFVDTLPPLCPLGKNDLGQCIGVAVPDTTTFPGSDYYEIELGQYTETLHSALPPTTLRGYRQTNTTNPDASKFNYLGPTILATRNRPVRVKFTNALPTGAGGDLFIPTDPTYMGAGNGPDGTPYSQNRATLHLHGGNTPWISDGTPHQWTAPGLEASTHFTKGVSVANVPDMWFTAAGALIPTCAGAITCTVAGATNDPGPGRLTFYWTNQESGRLMFYHDHAYGITRLNVYVGEAAGYLLTDPAQESALKAATVPGTIPDLTNLATADLTHLVPLVIQDKTFVPDNGAAGGQLAATDPTWDTVKFGGKGSLWFTHVYMPNQNPADATGANSFGRWDYGPWFWPPQDPTTLVGQPYPCTSIAYPAGSPPAFPPLMCPGTPNPSGTPESFMDTPIINGTAYPSLTVDPAAYRFQILSAGNDRTLNLGLYVAEPLSVSVLEPGSGYTITPTVSFTGGAGGGTGAAATAVMSTGSVTAILVTGVGAGYTSTPGVTITGDGTGAAAMAVINPINGQVTAVNVTNIGTGYSYANVAIDPPAGCLTGCVTATAIANVTASGELVGIVVTNPGSAPWTAAPTVVISAPPVGGKQATATASVNTEVKMIDAVPHTSASTLKPCSTSTAIGGSGLAAAALDAAGNPLNGTGLPANCYPSTWPTDGRDGGVPDPLTVGPPFIQMGTEGGLSPQLAVIPSTPIGYEYNRRSITVLNIFFHGLLLGPAERADVVVDFSQFAGKTLILYNDAPAPVPAFDPRWDYYTGNPDTSPTGGTPSTITGYGPNTRTLMQIKVNATGTANNFSLPALTAALPGLFASTQDRIIVPEMAYPPANGGATTPTYARIQDTSIAAWTGGPISKLQLTAPGAGYDATPLVTISGGGGAGATATAVLSATAIITPTLTNGGARYTTPPTVSVTGGGGTGGAVIALLPPRAVASIAVTNGGSGYTTTPTVTIALPPCTPGPGCVRATAIARVGEPPQRRVVAIAVTNGGAGYTSPPTITITGPTGSGATAVATLAGASVIGLQLVSGGSGYTGTPTISFSGGGGVGAAALGKLAPTKVASLTLTNGGNGYTSAPTVVIAPVDGVGGGATAVAVASAPLLPKAIQELFTLDYGRMNATLGVEIPFTNFFIQTTIPYGYIDPPTEIFKDGETQVWKITHNGVDTHFIHFHLFTVQVINRVGWDGAIKPPDANEMSWKDTVRMNPLEDIIVALRPMTQTLPWDLPNSIRALDVTQPLGTSLQFTNIDPSNQPAVVTNDLTNFGWEYVWHCHILGHEENDMMRAMIMAVPPRAAGTPTAVKVGTGNAQVVNLSWADNSLNETGFEIQRTTITGIITGTWSTITTTVSNVTTYQDAPPRGATYVYRVVADNLVGYTQVYAAPAIGYPNTTVQAAPSAASNPVIVN